MAGVEREMGVRLFRIDATIMRTSRFLPHKAFTCPSTECLLSQANIMKHTDGLFLHVFNEIGKVEYPEIKRDNIIVDIGAAMLADQPDKFDVLVMPNLYGDILSDIAAQVSGSVGIGGSANIGEHIAMFEAIHGSAPDIAGKDLANPSGLLLAAVQMLNHIEHPKTSSLIYNAWVRTIEDGIHTGDIARGEMTKKKVGTKEFARAVIERLGQKPQRLAPAPYVDAPHRDRAHEVCFCNIELRVVRAGPRPA